MNVTTPLMVIMCFIWLLVALVTAPLWIGLGLIIVAISKAL